MAKIKDIKTNENILQFNQLKNGDLFIFIDGKDGENSKDILIKQSGNKTIHLTMGDCIEFPKNRKVKLVTSFNFIRHF